MLKNKTQRMTTAGMLIAVGLLLPYACAHGMGLKGMVFLPMHIPVLLIGLLCGPLYGGVCGIVIPFLNSILTGMPALFPALPMMAGELCAYGLVGGLFMSKTRLGKLRFGVYPALVGALVAGRVVYALIFEAFMLAVPGMKASTVIASLMTGIPGIIVQILFIPSIVLALGGKQGDALSSAMTLIREGRASSIVIKNNKIVKTEMGRGIAPVIALYEEGVLTDATIADKIVGKAAAMMFSLGGVRECYGETMSRKAYEWLLDHKVHASYGTLVEEIVNRAGTGQCPMEETVKNITDEKLALVLLKAKVKELQNR